MSRPTGLLPCPFCGGEARHYAPGPIVHHIGCVECYADIHRGTEAEAIAAWNARVEPVSGTCERVKAGTKPDGTPRYRCSNCKYGIGDTRWAYCPKCGARVATWSSTAAADGDRIGTAPAGDAGPGETGGHDGRR